MQSAIEALKKERDKAQRDFERIDPKNAAHRDRRAYLHGVYHGLMKAIRQLQSQQPMEFRHD